MGWSLVLLGLLFAPIVWAFTKGRTVREATEDREGMSAYGSSIKQHSIDWQGPHGSGSGGSG
jgi:hypothetical protein